VADARRSHSAFARLVRDGELTSVQRESAVRLLDQLRYSWDEILPAEAVRVIAESLPDDYGLRAGDAWQLAAALVWCRERPRHRPFVCLDKRLAKAASDMSFTVNTSRRATRTECRGRHEARSIQDCAQDQPQSGSNPLKLLACAIHQFARGA
jgi:hypothetical protein